MMVLDDSLYQDEIRDGYYVSARRKRAWAVMLGLLDAFDEFCCRYNLRYFVYYGTILGAVRHKGFIPWDDDLDVVMLREDYARMQQLAPQYFSYPYRYEDAYSNTGHAWIMSKLRDDRTTVLEGFGREHDLYQSMYIDIHPWDDVPDDAGLGDATLYMSNELWMLVVEPERARTMYGEGYRFALGRETVAGLLEASFDVRFKAFETFVTALAGKSTRVNLLAEKFREYGHPDNLRAWCEQTVRVPFENLSVPVPIGYQQMMIDFFREYMRPVMHGSVHEGICIDPDHPYTEYVSGMRDPDELKPLEDGTVIPDELIDHSSATVSASEDGNTIKTLLIHTDASFLITDPDHSLASIGHMIDTMSEHHDRIRVIWYQSDTDMELLSIADPEVVESYLSKLDEFDRRGLGEVVQSDPDRPDATEEAIISYADAYYGDGSYLANACRTLGKPVMIRDITLVL